MDNRLPCAVCRLAVRFGWRVVWGRRGGTQQQTEYRCYAHPATAEENPFPRGFLVLAEPVFPPREAEFEEVSRVDYHWEEFVRVQ